MREGEAQQTVLTAGHLPDHVSGDDFGRGEPVQIECLLGRLAVAVDRHDEHEAHRVLARVVEPTDRRIGKVLGDRERSRRRRDLRQCERPEVLLAVAHQRVADPFAVLDPAADDEPADRAIGGLAEQETDLGDVTEPIDPHRDGLDVHDRELGAHLFQMIVGQPGVVGCGVDVAHGGSSSQIAPLNARIRCDRRPETASGQLSNTAMARSMPRVSPSRPSSMRFIT